MIGEDDECVQASILGAVAGAHFVRAVAPEPASDSAETLLNVSESHGLLAGVCLETGHRSRKAKGLVLLNSIDPEALSDNDPAQ